jgi:hypothetical protein
MVWGADIGHGEGIWPYAGFPTSVGIPDQPEGDGLQLNVPELPPIEGAIKNLLGGLPAATMVPYLQDNFFRAYPNVKKDELKKTVDRIGPTVTELGLV